MVRQGEHMKRIHFDVDFTVDEHRKRYGSEGATREGKIRRNKVAAAICGCVAIVLLVAFALLFDLPQIASETRSGSGPSPTLMASFICATAGLLAAACAGRCLVSAHRLRRGMIAFIDDERLRITTDGYLLFGSREPYACGSVTGHIHKSPTAERVRLRLAYLPWCSFRYDPSAEIVVIQAQRHGAIGFEIFASRAIFEGTGYGSALVRDLDPSDFAQRYMPDGIESFPLFNCFEPDLVETLRNLGVKEDADYPPSSPDPYTSNS